MAVMLVFLIRQLCPALYCDHKLDIMKNALAGLAALTLLSLSTSQALAQEASVPTAQEEATTLDDIVVLARRSGAPMWTVTRGESSLILVGAIGRIPRDVTWRPDDLEAAAARSDLILTPQVGQASVSDILRVIWRARTIGQMSRGTTTATYLSHADQARLETIMAGERNQGWRTKSLLFLSLDLMKD